MLVLLVLGGVGAVSSATAFTGVALPATRAQLVPLLPEHLARGVLGEAAAAPRSTPSSGGSGSRPPSSGAAPRLAHATSGGTTASEPPPTTGPPVGDATSPDPPHRTSDGKLILNLATMVELTQLPGIGQKRAQAILELRQRLKRFRKLTDLLRVRGIGRRRLQLLLPHLVLDPPEAPAQPITEQHVTEQPARSHG